MAGASSVIDTTILIAHLRGDRRLTCWLRDALQEGVPWVVSTLSLYEVYRAAQPRELTGLDDLFARCWAIPVNVAIAREAARIWSELREDGYTVDVPDQLIAATARVQHVAVATLNVRHFGLVRGLQVLDPLASGGRDPR